MSPPEDEAAPLLRPLWSQLDRWFAPPWRALLTWFILIYFSAQIEDGMGESDIGSVVQWQIGLINRLLTAPLPKIVEEIGSIISVTLFLTWFEPLALRLNFVRGAAWLALRIVPFLLFLYVFDGTGLIPALVVCFLASIAQVVALRGWRSRPWMAAVSMAAVTGTIGATGAIYQNLPGWWWMITLSTLYALPLLYGTNLLSPEERAVSQSP